MADWSEGMQNLALQSLKYLHISPLPNAYVYQIWQGGGLPWGAPTLKITTLSSCGLPKSRDKREPLDLCYQIAYDHQTWQNGNLSWWTPAHNHLITSSCEIMWQTRTIISPISRCLSPPNLIGWWLTLSSSHPKLLDPLVTWFCKITWQTKTISPPLTQSLWPSNLAGWWLTLRDSYHYHHLTL